MRRASTAPSFPADLKSVNRMQIMEVFKSGKEYTANDISEEIGLSRQTVMKAVQFFVEKGIIVSHGKGSSTNIGGKRPELFSLASNKYLMCISIWPDVLQFTLMDLRAGVVDQLSLQQSLSPDPQVAPGQSRQSGRQAPAAKRHLQSNALRRLHFHAGDRRLQNQHSQV